MSPIIYNESTKLDDLIYNADGYSPIYLDNMKEYLDFESNVTNVLKKLGILSKDIEHRYSNIDQKTI